MAPSCAASPAPGSFASALSVEFLLARFHEHGRPRGPPPPQPLFEYCAERAGSRLSAPSKRPSCPAHTCQCSNIIGWWRNQGKLWRHPHPLLAGCRTSLEGEAQAVHAPWERTESARLAALGGPVPALRSSPQHALQLFSSPMCRRPRTCTHY